MLPGDVVDFCSSLTRKSQTGTKRSRFSEEQIIAILKEQAARIPTADVCRKHGVSFATFSKYKSKFGGLEVSDARRLRTLGTHRSLTLPEGVNRRWSLELCAARPSPLRYEFVSDSLVWRAVPHAVCD